MINRIKIMIRKIFNQSDEIENKNIPVTLPVLPKPAVKPPKKIRRSKKTKE